MSFCPIRNCSGILYEVDDLFVPAYIEIIKLGYSPESCCSGHLTCNINNTRFPMMFTFKTLNCHGDKFKNHMTNIVDNPMLKLLEKEHIKISVTGLDVSIKNSMPLLKSGTRCLT